MAATYKQTSVAIKRNLKLAAKYYGPYQVVAKVGAVAYKLQLPLFARIDLVFHIPEFI